MGLTTARLVESGIDNKMDKKRKPDFETESFRMWSEKKKGKEEVGGFEIKYKDMKMKLCGFNICRKEGKIIFAYKFKHEEGEGLILIHNPKINKESEKIESMLRAMALAIGYEVKDTQDVLKNLYGQKHLFEDKEADG